MKISNQTYWQAIQKEKEKLDELRKKTKKAQKDLDTILNEVSAQRTAKTQVDAEKMTLSEKIGSLKLICNGIEQDIKYRKYDSDKQQEDNTKKVESIKLVLKSLDKEIRLFEKKKWDILDVDLLNSKVKEDISALNEKKQTLESDINELEKQKTELEEDVKNRKEILENEKENIRVENWKNIEEKRRLAREKNRIRKFCKENNISIKDI